MKTYNVTLTGLTPLLQHADNIEWAERKEAWQKDPANKSQSRAGDDRSPGFTYVGYIYHDENWVGVGSDNLMTCLRDGGTRMPAKKGKGSLKGASQSELLVNEALWPLEIDRGGKWAKVPWQPIDALKDEASFAKHEELAAKLGYALFTCRARVGQAKHVRVRPRFERWRVSGTITSLNDSIFDTSSLKTLLSFAGRYAGLCDWRPGSTKSGQFGMFKAELSEA